MATYAACLTEKRRLSQAPKRITARIVKNPFRANDGAAVPTAGDDYLLEIKDPRPTGTGPAAAADSDSQANFRTQAAALADTRWHDDTAAQEHEIRIRGLVRGVAVATRGAAATADVPGHPGWLLYDTGTTREGGDIPDSAVVFA
jgi:hypothetical protein